MTSDPLRAELRARLRARREALSPVDRIAAAQSLPAMLERIPEYLTDRRIAGYWAVGGELPLLALMPGLRERGQAWHLPVLGDDRTLRFAPWQPGDAVEPNRYGIPEPRDRGAGTLWPDELDVVLVPLLGFDRRGHRLGFGGGWYDRSFAFLQSREGVGRPLLVGVGYALQEVARVPVEAWDVRLDYVATERELIDLTPPE
ncbi:MAG TPA: 5-formyltetrahydrofolate cyclo-ligase [Dokdonella sp.]